MRIKAYMHIDFTITVGGTQESPIATLHHPKCISHCGAAQST